MFIFEDIQDVKEWLEPLDYLAFWKAVEPYDLVLQDRDHCDDLIASGKVEATLVLEVLKGLAEMELADAFGLEWRIYQPYISATH
ncbi:MAG: hypothetical protein GY927_03325 [bacterium]|nr:hypothetical protein [bacterium]